MRTNENNASVYNKIKMSAQKKKKNEFKLPQAGSGEGASGVMSGFEGGRGR